MINSPFGLSLRDAFAQSLRQLTKDVAVQKQGGQDSLAVTLLTVLLPWRPA
jgi:hypothetical protein